MSQSQLRIKWPPIVVEPPGFLSPDLSGCKLYIPLWQQYSNVWNKIDGKPSTVTGAVWTAKGRDFDIVDDVITVGSDAVLTPASALSFEVWLKNTRTTAGHRILEKWGNLNTKYCYLLSMGDNAAGTVRFGLSANSSVNMTLIDTTATINNGAFHHIVCTWARPNMTVYIDKVSRATGSFDFALINSTKLVCIGGDDTADGSPFGGTIGEARIYNRALTVDEVQSHYLKTIWRYV